MQHNYFIAWPRTMKIGQIDVLFPVTRSKMKRRVTYNDSFKGGYLDFSHLTELKKIYITEIYMIKQYQSSIIKNPKIEKKKKKKRWCFLKRPRSLFSYF